MTLVAVLGPRLTPETTRSGRSRSSAPTASFTLSAGVPEEEAGPLHRDLGPAGGAAGDDPAAHPDRLEVLVDGCRPDRVEDHVGAPAAGQLPHRAGEALARQRLLGAEGPGLAALFLRATGGDHPGPEVAAEED